MADVIATFPGKMGDVFLQWPVARAYAKANGGAIDIGLPPDMGSIGQLMSIQDEVDEVTFLHGINKRSWKMDPPEMGIEKKPFMRWQQQLEMGFRDFPDDQITLYTAKCMGLPVEGLDKPSIYVGAAKTQDYCVLHGTAFSISCSTVPRFWDCLDKWRTKLEKKFKRLIFIGAPDDLKLAEGLGYETFSDDGNILASAQAIRDARFLIGSSSSMAALGSVMGVPLLRIHDPIEGLKKRVHDLLLPNQLNYLGEEYPEEFVDANARPISGSIVHS